MSIPETPELLPGEVLHPVRRVPVSADELAKEEEAERQAKKRPEEERGGVIGFIVDLVKEIVRGLTETNESERWSSLQGQVYEAGRKANSPASESTPEGALEAARGTDAMERALAEAQAAGHELEGVEPKHDGLGDTSPLIARSAAARGQASGARPSR